MAQTKVSALTELTSPDGAEELLINDGGTSKKITITNVSKLNLKGGDLTSADPLVIDTDGNYFDVTGTTSFAAMTVAADRQFTLQFDGILTMTHHATNLDLPGAANITTAAGDVATFQSTGANTVQCINYTKASGNSPVDSLPLAGGTMTGSTIHNDDVKSIYGTSSDGLEIYHDGSHSYVKDTGTGNLHLRGAATVYIGTASMEDSIVCAENGAVTLLYDNTNKLATTATGIDVTGSVTCDGADLNGAVTINESGADVDFRVESTGDTHALFVDGGATNSRVGIGVTPETTWESTKNVLQIGGTGALVSETVTNGGNISLSTNWYFDGSSHKYMYTDEASYYAQADGTHRFFVAPSGSADANITWQTRLRIDTDGIKFNDDTAAANALDDYEEGSFTATFADAASGGNESSTTGAGHYTKIGNVVHVSISKDSIDTTGCSGTIFITGFPFTSSMHHFGSYYTYRSGGGTTHHSSVMLANTNSYANITEGTGTSGDTDRWLEFGDWVDGTTSFYCSLVYRAA